MRDIMKNGNDFFAGNEWNITRHAATLIVSEAWKAVVERGRFTFVLSGGRSPAALYRKIASGIEPELMRVHGIPVPEPPEALHNERFVLPWHKTFIFWGDERCVPADHPDSNYRMARETLLDAPGTGDAQVFRMPCDELPPDDAADRYENTIRSILGETETRETEPIPVFDVILLGLGDDGHTASLFPGDQNALAESQRLVIAVTPSEARPPVPRLTMTLPLINNAKTICFFTSGKKRTAMAEAIRLRKAPYAWPANRVIPSNGKRFWFIANPSTH
jgi:6-phosphogluconolactonase